MQLLNLKLYPYGTVKTCSGLPNTSSAGANGTVSISLNGYALTTTNASAYLANTTIQLTCPCGYEWTPPLLTDPYSLFLEPRPAAGNSSTTINVTCLEKTGWDLYHITQCVPRENS
jgi:hypothetical protein